MKAHKILSSKAAYKYLRTNISSYDQDRIRIAKINKTFHVYLIQDNKFIEIEEVSDYEFNTLITKLQEYFDGKKWDDSVYVQVYTSKQYEVTDRGPVIQLTTEISKWEHLVKLRERYNPGNQAYRLDLCFRSVDKPKEFITFQEVYNNPLKYESVYKI